MREEKQSAGQREMIPVSASCMHRDLGEKVRAFRELLLRAREEEERTGTRVDVSKELLEISGGCPNCQTFIVAHRTPSEGMYDGTITEHIARTGAGSGLPGTEAHTWVAMATSVMCADWRTTKTSRPRVLTTGGPNVERSAGGRLVGKEAEFARLTSAQWGEPTGR